ncbi:MAG TPA: hypothetical protein VII02_12165 [Gemmatimonadaceae bacterium]
MHLTRIVGIAGLILSTASTGQTQAPSASDSPAKRDTTRVGEHYKFATRAGVGLLGGTAGFVLGVYAGFGIAGPCNGCGDDFHGFGEALVGAAIGAIVGTGTAAAIPKFGGNCSYGKRAGLGLAGSLIGGIGAIGILFLRSPINRTAALVPPLGAAIALKGC